MSGRRSVGKLGKAARKAAGASESTSGRTASHGFMGAGNAALLAAAGNNRGGRDGGGFTGDSTTSTKTVELPDWMLPDPVTMYA